VLVFIRAYWSPILGSTAVLNAFFKITISIR
jgi:hypothetical protein